MAERDQNSRLPNSRYFSAATIQRLLLALALSVAVVTLGMKWLLQLWGPIRLAMALMFVGVGLMWLGYLIVRFRLILVTAGLNVLLSGAYGNYSNSVPYPTHSVFTAWGGIPNAVPDALRDLEGGGPVPRPPLVVVVATGADEPEAMIRKLGCGTCHKIPTTFARFGTAGPLLIEKDTAALRVSSPEYQRRFKAGKAHAQTAKDYVIESIVSPSAYIVPEFTLQRTPALSMMFPDYKNKLTYEALDKLADFLLSLDETDAARDGLVTSRSPTGVAN